MLQTKRHYTTFLIAFLALFAAASTATACPVCNSETGQQVRAQLFGADFTSNTLAILAPVPFLLISAYALTEFLGKQKSRP